MEKQHRKYPYFTISLVLWLISLILVSGFLSGWGSAKVSRNTVQFENGLRYSYLSYVQKSATNENPGPAVVVFHGKNDNAQGFSQWAVELVRRGYSVFIADLGQTGMTDSGFSNDKDIAIDFVNRVKGLPFIDASRVVSTGHSKGGSYAYITANVCDLAGGIAVSGMRSDRSVSDPYTGNLVTLIGTGDWMNPLTGIEDRNIQYIQTVYGEEFGEGNLPVDGKEYGSLEDKTYRVFETFSGIFSQHAAARYNPNVIKRVCYYAEKMVPTGTSLSSDNSVVNLYFLTELLSAIAFTAVLISLLLHLASLPFFASVKREIPACIGRTGSKWAKSAALSIIPVVPLFILLPYISEKYLHASTASKLFPVGTTNRFLLYFLSIGILEICLFFFTYYRKEKVTPVQCGFVWGEKKRDNLINLGKSALLAAFVAGTGLTLLYILENVFGISMTSWWMMMRAPSWTRVWKSLAYLPIFFILFIGMQLGCNVSRRFDSTGHPIRDIARDVIVNCLIATGIITLYFFVNMWCNDHGIFWAVVDNVGHSYYMYNFMLIGNLVTTINTILYRKTGTIWPGVFTCTILIGTLVPAGCPII